METFKVGDKVKITRSPTKGEQRYAGGWSNRFDDYVNKTGEIFAFAGSHKGLCVKLGYQNNIWIHPATLVKIEEVEIKKTKQQMTKEFYIKTQAQLGFEEGEVVVLSGIFSDTQFGWNGTYDTDLEDKVGDDATIVSILSGNQGIEIQFLDDLEDDNDAATYYVPFFALEKSENTKRSAIKISDDYTAVISEDSIKVGCQTINYADFDKLVRAVKLIRGK